MTGADGAGEATAQGRGSRTRAIALIASGTAVANGIAFISTAALSRLFTPAEFGTFSVLVAIVMTWSTVLAGRVEAIIPLPSEDDDAYGLLVLGALVALTSVAVGLAGVLLLESIARDALPSAVETLGWTIPVMALPVATFQLLNAWALRQGRFGAIARRSVLQALVTAIAQVGAGFAGWSIGGLIVGYVLGQAVGSLSLLLSVSPLLRRVTKERLGILIRQYRGVPLMLGPAGLLNSLSLQAPVLLVALLYGAEAAGWFGLSQRVLAVPIVLIAQATASVYASELARLRRTESAGVAALFWSTSKQLGLAVVVVCPVILVAAEPAFRAVFGPQWAISGDVARAMTLLIAGQMLAFPVSQTLIVFERNALQLLWDACRLIAVVSVIVILSNTGASLTETVWAYSSTAAVFYAISWELSRRTIRRFAASSVRRAGGD